MNESHVVWYISMAKSIFWRLGGTSPKCAKAVSIIKYSRCDDMVWFCCFLKCTGRLHGMTNRKWYDRILTLKMVSRQGNEGKKLFQSDNWPKTSIIKCKHLKFFKNMYCSEPSSESPCVNHSSKVMRRKRTEVQKSEHGFV